MKITKILTIELSADVPDEVCKHHRTEVEKALQFAVNRVHHNLKAGNKTYPINGPYQLITPLGVTPPAAVYVGYTVKEN